MDLKELSKNLHLVLLPSSLWAAHIDPHYEFIAIVHLQFKFLTNLEIDKGIVITFNTTNQMLEVSFFLHNSFVQIPTAKSSITSPSDITNLIYSIHNLRWCKNSQLQVQHPHCSKYVNPDQEFCQFCNWERFGLQIHTESSEKVTYTCEYCNKSFLDKIVMEEHVNSHQTATVHKSGLCNVCGKTYRQYCRLKQHLLTHSTENKFFCDTCDKIFSKPYNLKLHKKTHTGVRPHICSTCGKTYTTQSNLRMHIRSTHTKTKPCICETCGMSFVYPRHLRIHIRKHTGEKPYKCVICDRSFAKNIHLTVHMRIHTGEKPYVCASCGKGYTTTGNLNSHRKVHHKDVLPTKINENS